MQYLFLIFAYSGNLIDMKNPNKKIIEGHQTLNSFFEQFGDRDVYTMIVLEEVFKEIYGSYDYAWYVSIALSIFAGLIHLPIEEKQVKRLQTV